MNTMMKAFVVERPGVQHFIDVAEPVPGPRDVLCRVAFCGICGTDMAIMSGNTTLVRDGLIKYPVRIGHEWSGVVASVGSEVREFKPGDRVVGDDLVACGQCRDCLEGNYIICKSAWSVGTVNCWDGAFAEYMLMPARQMYHLPDQVGLAEAALIEPAAIAYNGLVKLGRLTGSTILVSGTGPIGLSAVGIARAMGARVILSGRRPGKLAIGRTMGAQFCVNSTSEDLQQEIAKYTDRVDFALETSGSELALHQCLQIVRPGGGISTVAFYERNIDNVNVDQIVLQNKTLYGAAGAPNAFPPVISLIENGDLSLQPLITAVYSFSRMPEAVEEVRQDRDGRIKVLIQIGAENAI